MGRAKKKAKTGHPNAQHGGKQNSSIDPVRALVACRPSDTRGSADSNDENGRMQAAIALHESVRLVSLRLSGDAKGTVELIASVEAKEKEEPNVVRALSFSPDGRFLAVAGDDKALYVYAIDDGDDAPTKLKLVRRTVSPKKFSSLTWVDGSSVLAANKYGDVTCVDVREGGKEREMMGHFCSIVLSLEVGEERDGKRLLSSTDRDGKVRVTTLDMGRLHDAGYNHEIQSFCLGHTSYVSGGVFAEGGKKALLVTGGGDGVRVWDPVDGQQQSERANGSLSESHCAMWEDRKVLEIAHVKDFGNTMNERHPMSVVTAIFDGDEANACEDVGVLVVNCGDKIDGSFSQGGRQLVKTGMKLSGVAADNEGRHVWVIGAGDASTPRLLVYKCNVNGVTSDPLASPVELTVAGDVFADMPAWDVPSSFFASYYNKGDAGVMN